MDRDPARAERDAERASRWLPWSSEALRLAGEAELAQGKRRQARATFVRAVEKDPLDWELWFDLAVASDGRARVRAARRAERLNPLAPQIDEARAQLGLGTGRR
ncbi:MAG: tetratricopeptide repeat protein [Actinobacteria bacterium]|nr:tetratricopeptide repeat protein [Actinomycetota bacterium]